MNLLAPPTLSGEGLSVCVRNYDDVSSESNCGCHPQTSLGVAPRRYVTKLTNQSTKHGNCPHEPDAAILTASPSSHPICEDHGMIQQIKTGFSRSKQNDS